MGDGTSAVGQDHYPTHVFTDTSVLLNYVQRGVEPDYSSSLIDSNQLDIVVGVSVAEEIDSVYDRRFDIYMDFIDFLLAEEGQIGEYDLGTRRPYFQTNDREHIRNIQMQLAQLNDRAEIQRQLRHLTRMFVRRLDHLRDEVIPKSLFDAQPGLTVLFGLEEVIQNDDDRKVIADAALWAAEGEHDSNVFVTLDRRDILDVIEAINDALCETKDDEWRLQILRPEDLIDIARKSQTSSSELHHN